MGFKTLSATFNTINDLKQTEGTDNITAEVLGYYTAGDGGGGTFYFDSFSAEVDNGGTIIDPIPGNGNGRWKRVLTGRNLNLLWFGAFPAGVAFDNLVPFNNALSAIISIPDPPIIGYNMRGKIYIPGAQSSYYFSDTVTLLDSVEISGEEGWDSFHATILEWPTNTTGISIPAATGSVRGAHNVFLSNLMLLSTHGNNVNKHGIDAHRTCFGYNITVERFSGTGLNIDTTVSGLADLCYFEKCSFYSNDVGIWTRGVDSNQCTFIHTNCFGNYRAGVFEKSFLGNIYINLHTNSNTELPGNPVWAFHNGKTYAALQDHTNVEPGVTSGWENYWVSVDFGVLVADAIYPEWSNSFAYKEGGAVVSRGSATNGSTFVGLYMEGGQPPISLAPYNIVLGIGNGAGWRTNSAILYGNDGLYSAGGFNCAVNQSYGKFPFQNAAIDQNGLSLYPISQIDGTRLTATSLQFVADPGIFAQLTQNSLDFSAYWLLRSSMTGASGFFGRSAIADGMIHLPRGTFIGSDQGSSTGRYFGMASAIPTTGEHAKGDFLLKIITGAGDTVLGFRCTVSGTPGTWETLHVTIT